MCLSQRALIPHTLHLHSIGTWVVSLWRNYSLVKDCISSSQRPHHSAAQFPLPPSHSYTTTVTVISGSASQRHYYHCSHRKSCGRAEKKTGSECSWATGCIEATSLYPIGCCLVCYGCLEQKAVQVTLMPSWKGMSDVLRKNWGSWKHGLATLKQHPPSSLLYHCKSSLVTSLSWLDEQVKDCKWTGFTLFSYVFTSELKLQFVLDACESHMLQLIHLYLFLGNCVHLKKIELLFNMSHLSWS